MRESDPIRYYAFAKTAVIESDLIFSGDLK
jgi:hypothetical protein